MSELKTNAIKSVATIALLALTGPAAAAPVVIDFEGLPTYFGLSSHSEENFTLTSNQPSGTLIDDNNLVRANIGAPGTGTDSLSLFWGANGATSTVTLSSDFGYGFALDSFDASSLYNGSGVLTITGNKAGGGSVIQNLTLDSNLTTYNITGMTGLTSLELSFDGSTYFAPYDLDNISLNVVPIPAAVWLFGSGLAMLGWLRRRGSPRA